MRTAENAVGGVVRACGPWWVVTCQRGEKENRLGPRSIVTFLNYSNIFRFDLN
jgi:hypothetical protein